MLFVFRNQPIYGVVPGACNPSHTFAAQQLSPAQRFRQPQIQGNESATA